MRFRAACLLTITLSAWTTASSSEARVTIPALVARFGPQPVMLSRQRELMPLPLPEVLASATLVMRGTIEAAHSYLSDDQTEVLTDYGVRVTKVYGRAALPSPRITFRQWGGRLVLNGVVVTAEDKDVEAVGVGDDVVFALVGDHNSATYRLVSPTSGAFAVRSGRTIPLVQHPAYARYQGMAVEAFEAELRRLLR
jgi:hypothetical protein